ncbi:stabilizer of axonemal microtubules 2 isoform X1 [Ornithorhynchus anatinus]|nr:stabilizer of axonemal microtubules 2 isoform X1 [Ornithorhynchus anatinus]
MERRGRCLCEICTCGCHRCPRNPKKIYENSVQPCPTTEYLENYPQHGPVVPPPSLKPKQEIQANHGKMEGITTFKSDYRPYPVERRPPREQGEHKPQQGEMDLGTTYQRDFSSHRAPLVTLVRSVERRLPKGAQLDTVPTYRDDFRAWATQKRDRRRPAQDYHPPTVKFGNPTTFQDDFYPKESRPRPSFKPPCGAKPTQVPFAGVTSHRQAYVAHQLEPRCVRPKEAHEVTSQPLEGLTTHRNDFRGLLGEAGRSLRPQHTILRPNGPFDGSTESRESFQPWPVSLPAVRQTADYVPPVGPMELSTTSQLDYTPHPLHPAAPRRPVFQRRRAPPPFQGNSTTKEDFQAWESCRQEMIKRPPEISRASGRFDGSTTFGSHFVPHVLVPTLSCKPSHAALRCSVPFEARTVYDSEYTPKKREICPAAFASPPGYVFQSTDSHGHRFFRKMAVPATKPLSPSTGCHAPQDVAVTA